jgi:hypothetical protein
MSVRPRPLGVLCQLLVVTSLESGGVASAESADQLTPVLAAVVAVPAPVHQTDGLWKLPYEIALTNATDVPVTIESVEVRAPERGDALVASLMGDELSANLSVPGATRTTTLGPGQTGILFANLSFRRREDVPGTLAHRLTATTPSARALLPARSVEDVARTTVLTGTPVVVGPPLRDDRWVAGASCCKSYHRRAMLPVNGERHLAQRFAIDWIQLDPQDRLATGDPSRNESYPQFGAEVLAVANARVAHVTDGLPQPRPGSFPADVTLTTADGNSVVLDLGGGRFALYAHLQPGSIRVKEGERVERGQVLGLVGNSGNSDAPHLHFHVMDGPSPLASNGLPYVIDSFDLVGQAVSGADLDSLLKTPQRPVEVSPETGPPHRREELPADLAVVRFPG